MEKEVLAARSGPNFEPALTAFKSFSLDVVISDIRMKPTTMGESLDICGLASVKGVPNLCWSREG